MAALVLEAGAIFQHHGIVDRVGRLQLVIVQRHAGIARHIDLEIAQLMVTGRRRPFGRLAIDIVVVAGAVIGEARDRAGDFQLVGRAPARNQAASPFIGIVIPILRCHLTVIALVDIGNTVLDDTVGR